MIVQYSQGLEIIKRIEGTSLRILYKLNSSTDFHILKKHVCNICIILKIRTEDCNFLKTFIDNSASNIRPKIQQLWITFLLSCFSFFVLILLLMAICHSAINQMEWEVVQTGIYNIYFLPMWFSGSCLILN